MLTLRHALIPCCLGLVTSMAIAADDSERSFEIYGFAQADYIQDFKRVNPAWDDTLRASRIPTESGQYGSDGQASISVKQSRFGIRATQPVNDQALMINFEFDLFGVGDDEGQTTMRLRHFYGEWGDFLAGQTNSLFMDSSMFPNVIDYWGPTGMVFLRNPQVRWTPMKGDQQFAIAIEKPGNDIDSGEVSRIIDPDDFPGLDEDSSIEGTEEIPDITAQYRMNTGWGHFQVAGILRRIGYETIGSENNRPKGEETGFGINLSTNINVPTGTVRLSVVNGKGIASYMNDGGVDMAPDGNEDNVSAEAVPLLGVVAYYDHTWNERWTSSIGYSFTEIDNQNLQSDDAFEKAEYASVNLLHTPADQVLLGVEALWGKRTDNDGDTGEDIRVQFSAKYIFSNKTKW